MSREAVLLQWERKIEDAERRESGRFERGAGEARPIEQDDPIAEEDGPIAEPVPLRPADAAAAPAPRGFDRGVGRRFDRGALAPAPRPTPVGERRTIKIAGQPAPPRRRRSVVEAQMAQPDRIALWAFLLGLFLVAVAAGTAHT